MLAEHKKSMIFTKCVKDALSGPFLCMFFPLNSWDYEKLNCNPPWLYRVIDLEVLRLLYYDFKRLIFSWRHLLHTNNILISLMTRIEELYLIWEKLIPCLVFPLVLQCNLDEICKSSGGVNLGVFLFGLGFFVRCSLGLFSVCPYKPKNNFSIVVKPAKMGFLVLFCFFKEFSSLRARDFLQMKPFFNRRNMVFSEELKVSGVCVDLHIP